MTAGSASGRYRVPLEEASAQAQATLLMVLRNSPASRRWECQFQGRARLAYPAGIVPWHAPRG